jgi:hypothetical protein
MGQRLLFLRASQGCHAVRSLQGPQIHKLTLLSWSFASQKSVGGRCSHLVARGRQLACPEQSGDSCRYQQQQHDCREPVPEFHDSSLYKKKPQAATGHTFVTCRGESGCLR